MISKTRERDSAN